ncbi:hypothetical protein ANN_00711 [Periplaneta americana]|uniref:Uncharacterized protein n=1 Tax=Periplaneta americana TaxID=6978 RepID=A0ABQ8TTY8_PERAM|nr:hypothetical protein ANN_00711 [Periplaneta americana]
MSPGSSTETYPAFAHIGLRENLGKNLNQVTCPDQESNPGHLVSRPDVLTIILQTFGYQEQPGQFQRVCDSLRRRAEECIAMNGHHIEHFLRTGVQISETREWRRLIPDESSWSDSKHRAATSERDDVEKRRSSAEPSPAQPQIDLYTVSIHNKKQHCYVLTSLIRQQPGPSPANLVPIEVEHIPTPSASLTPDVALEGPSRHVGKRKITMKLEIPKG